MNKFLTQGWSNILLFLSQISEKVGEVFTMLSLRLMEGSILPCPKCGGRGEDYFETGMELMNVLRCDNCGYMGKEAWDDPIKAIRLWNTVR